MRGTAGIVIPVHRPAPCFEGGGGAPFCRIDWGGRRLDETCHWGIDRSDRESAVQGEFLHLWRDFSQRHLGVPERKFRRQFRMLFSRAYRSSNPRLEPYLGANPILRLFSTILIVDT